MRALVLAAAMAACSQSHGKTADAPSQPDAAVDAAIDASPDAAPDAKVEFTGTPQMIAMGETSPHAIYALSGSLYWLDGTTDVGPVMKMPRNGTASVFVPANSNGLAHASLLASDGAYLYMYGGGSSTSCLYHYASLASPTVTCAQGYYPPYSSLCGIGYIAVDSGRVYSTAEVGGSSGCTSYAVFAGAQPGGAPLGNIATTGSVGASTGGMAYPIVAAGGRVYYGVDNQMHVVPGDGSAAATAFSTDTAVGQYAIADASDVYWTSGSELHGQARTAVGGAPMKLAMNQTPTWLALDADHLYWVDGGTEIHAVARTGGGVRTLVTDPLLVSTIAIDSAGLYWTDSDGTIWMLAR